MKKLSIYFTVGLVAILSLCSCEDFLDVNKSPDNPTSITADQVLPIVMFYSAQAQYDHAEYGVYLSQCLTTGGRAQVSGYPYKNGWEFLSVNRHPQWRRHFYDLGVNIFEMTEIAKEINSRNFAMIGRTIKLYSTLMTTDAFGDIPFRESYGHIESLKEYWKESVYISQSKTQPKYDKQSEIYDWMYKQIDELIELYNDEEWAKCETNKPINSTMDRIYAGDMQKWAAFTKALKARMLIRKLPNWDNTHAVCQEIIKTVDEVINDPNWQEPLFKFSADGSGEKNCPWGPTQPTCNLGWAQGRANLLTEAIPSKFFGYALLGIYQNTNYGGGPTEYSLDPRASKMMTPRKNKIGNTSLRYLENNIGMGTIGSETEAVHYPDMYALKGNNPFTKDDGYIALITTEELLFIKAEAQYWSGDKIGAYHTTRDAVQKSMERYGVMAADAESPEKEAKRHALFLEVRLREDDFTIADLMQQKYVAMYLQSEQWVDFRRYNQSSETNGIKYDGVYVYTVTRCHDEKNIKKKYKAEDFNKKFSLTRPFNLYEAYWTTPENFGINAKFSPNAWIQRFNYDPETEDKYNREELLRIGAWIESGNEKAKADPNWLRKRMEWGYKNNDYVSCADGTDWK